MSFRLRLVLGSEIFRGARHAVFIRAAMNSWRPGEIAVWRRRGRLPFERGGAPRVVFRLPAVLDAVKQIDDERNLAERQTHRAPEDDLVQAHHPIAQSTD